MTRELREYHHNRQYLNRNELEYEYDQAVQQLLLAVYVAEFEQLGQLQLGFVELLLVQALIENVAVRIQLHSFCLQYELVFLLLLLLRRRLLELSAALQADVDKLPVMLELAAQLVQLPETDDSVQIRGKPAVAVDNRKKPSFLQVLNTCVKALAAVLRASA